MICRFIIKEALLIILLLVSSSAKSQIIPTAMPAGTKVNVVHTWEALVPDTDPAIFKVRPFNEVKQTYQYSDGWGRLIQSVLKERSLPEGGTNSDLVVASYYDEFGREQLSYLPFAANNTGGNTSLRDGNFKLNPFQQQVTFNQSMYPGESYFYTSSTYDGTPLNRIVNMKLPGNKWNTDVNYKGVSTDYDFNKGIENVRIWNIDFTPGSLPVSVNSVSGYYGDGKLVKNITKDDRDKMIVEYKDLNGNVILKKVQEKEAGAGLDLNGHAGWLCTYYVYDDFNRLRYIITPKAVALLDPLTNGGAAAWVIDADINKGLCFYNEYDERGRLIIKHSPDGGEVFFIYDNRDRLVFSQDENQRTRLVNGTLSPQWSFSLYDDQDRNIVAGLVDNNNTRSYIAAQVNSLSGLNTTIALSTGASNEQIEAYMPVNAVAGNSGIVVNSVIYYDEYQTGSKPFETITNTDFAATSNLNIEPLSKTARTLGMQTGSKIRVLDDKYFTSSVTDDAFLIATTYYDDKGRVLQTLRENIRKGTDVSSVQYDWSGKPLSSNSKHRADNSSFASAAANLFNNCITIGKTEYDELGRASKIYKLFTLSSADISNTAKYKLLSEVSYDELGRIKTKKIGTKPGSTTEPMEIQDLTYNVQGWLTGINKDYAMALGTAAANQWYRKFGLCLGYDNADGKFVKAQYNGNITGTMWRSQGDNIPRKYDYDYDNINRFTSAAFTQIDNYGFFGAPTTYTNTTFNLSASVSGYDLNGNLFGMIQSGMIPGITGGVQIDNLSYSYFTKSNKLKNISDVAATSRSGVSGDFKDGGFTDEYNYDGNGNLLMDKNKSITDVAGTGAGIINNFLDLPQVLTVKGKSKTEYIYDAAGNKLAKKVTPVATNIPVITYFIGDFVYEGDNLQYILHEEGKLRIMSQVASCSPSCAAYVNSLTVNGNILLNSTAGKWGVWDYFIKDNLSNVRLVLTEEFQQQQMKCSMENSGTPNPKTEEETTFGQTGANNEVNATRFPKASSSWTSNTSAYVSKLLNVTGLVPSTTVGPNVILKVMAGDQLAASVKYFYQTTVNTSTTDIISNVASSLIAALTGSNNIPGTIKSNLPLLLNQTTNVNNPLYYFPIILGKPAPIPATNPRAYVNVIFFDEQFKFVKSGSTAFRVGNIASGNSAEGTIAFNKTVPSNGFAYIYLSNESTNIPVYFDDFTVSHNRGAITEDDAYYPFGLRVAGISAKAALKPTAKYGYQGDYALEDAETGYNEFDLRTYDPQIGRWIQTDPKDQLESPYIAMNNCPVNNIDPDGGLSLGLGSSIAGALIGGTAAYLILKNNPGMQEGWKRVIGVGLPLLGAGIGYGIGESLANTGSAARYYPDGYDRVEHGYNYGRNFWDNFKQFYVGLIGATSREKESKLGRVGTSTTSTPDINLLGGWRDNDLPDWDFWRIMKQREDTKFKLSRGGLIWRAISTAKGYTTFDEIGGNKYFFRIPALSWYFYWLIHKPNQKGLSPFNNKTRKESINNFFDRSTNEDPTLDIYTMSLFMGVFL